MDQMHLYENFVDRGCRFPSHFTLHSLNEAGLYAQPLAAYPFVALAGEAGELLNVLKKLVRDQSGIINSAERAKLLLELGDVLWYTVACAHALDATLLTIMKLNETKLNERARGKTKVTDEISLPDGYLG